MRIVRHVLAGVVCALPAIGAAQSDWKPMTSPLTTEWGKNLDPQHTLPEYPRPQMTRPDWVNLNGVWDLSLSSKRATDFKFDQKILVPFPVESALSGIEGKVDGDTLIRYRRQFTIPSSWAGKRVLLHFGAVDWSTDVQVNGKEVGTHKGGYDPFAFDITEALKKGDSQTLEVQVSDPTDGSTQPRGKQSLKPSRIFYTPTSGIWQTVWIEPVPDLHIQWLTITPDFDKSEVRVKVDATGSSGLRIEATALDGEDAVADGIAEAEHEIVLRVPHAKPWTPRSAFLYRLQVKLLPRDSNQPIDQVQSYFGMRKISLGKVHGVTRIFLNNEPFFMFGVLDQGFWPDGLYTAPSDAALRSDIVAVKGLGFNLIRKHVKVEPDRWYYWCDKLGLLVWQDMPSGDASITPEQPDITRTSESSADFENELDAMVHAHYNHPCIVQWVLFNEGWGQFDTERLTKHLKGLDPSRLVDSTSGWSDRGVGDVIDKHAYPGPDADNPTSRAAVLGEFGGLGLPLQGHMWAKDGWSYQDYKSTDDLTNGFLDLLAKLRPLMSSGLSAAIYTQTTDVETELNGLLTYDREVVKVNKDEVRTAIDALYGPPPNMQTISPVAKDHPVAWRYTTYQPDTEWMQPTYDDSSWALGQSGFGTSGTPGAIATTKWDEGDIWMRREFEVPAGKSQGRQALFTHHAQDAEVYIDGVQVAVLTGKLTTYESVAMDSRTAALSPGKHILAIHSRRGKAGQYIDCGIVEISGPRQR
jgi:hypothetical protein